MSVRVVVDRDGVMTPLVGKRIFVWHTSEKLVNAEIEAFERDTTAFIMAGGDRPPTVIDSKVVQEQGVKKLFNSAGAT